MAQNVLDYTYDPTGNELMDEYLPKMAENCLTNNSGIARPTYAVENTVWVDTSDDDTWRYKIYDGTSDIVLFELDNITKKINFPNITGVFRFKGSVATVSALPATGNLPGDVYNVIDGGANYAWNDSEWDKLSENLEWGRIVGTLSNQTDLQNALNAKYDASNPSGYQANVIETVKVNGTALTPSSKAVDITVPAAQVNSDWNASSGVAQILNKPSLATVATSGSYNDLSNKPTIPAAQVNSDWNASSGVAQILNKPTIPTVNNATLTITQGGTTKGTFTANASSNVTIALDAGGGGSVDNKSITTNSSSQLQTVGVINSRDTSTAIKTWTGTRAQYNAIASKDANTLYNITDDTDVSLTILEALYPVGSVYITTAASCPLSTLISGSTWTLQSSAIVTSVNTNVPVKGTGKTLGLTDGTNNVGMTFYSGAGLNGATENYGVNVGGTGTTWPLNGYKGIGVTTDASKSGIVGTVTRSTLAVNIFRRTA